MDVDGYSYALFKTSANLFSHDYEFYIRKYGQIPYPVLVIWGTEDSAIPLSFGEQLIGAIPKAKMHTIDQCGHNPHEEFPEEVAGLIISTAVDLVHKAWTL